MKHANKVKIVGRRIDLYAKTDLRATFARIRREQAAAMEERSEKVRPIQQRKKA